MNILDIAPDPHEIWPRIERIGGRVHPPQEIDTLVPDTMVTDTLPPDSLPGDTLRSAQGLVNGVSTGGDDTSILLWSIVIVLFSLLICLYFVYAYRQRQIKV